MNRMMRRMMLMSMGRAASIPLVPTLPADASLYAGQVYLAPRWPLLASAPATVVNNQSFRLPGGTYGIEYLGVGGSWVAQPSVTMGVWKSKGVFKNDGNDWVDLGVQSYINYNKLNNGITVRVLFKPSDTTTSGYLYAVNDAGQLALLSNNLGLGNVARGTYIGASSTISVPQYQMFWNDFVLCKNGVKVFARCLGPAVEVAFSPTTSWTNTGAWIGGRSGGSSVNYQGEIALVEFYDGSNPDCTINGLTLLDRYDFDKWNGSGSDVSDKGNAYTVTDGTPFTAKSYAWIPQ